MDRVNWMLILTGEAVLALGGECLNTFQVRFVVLHRFRLSPWAHASSLLANHSASSLRLWFSFPFFLCGLSFLWSDLERSLTRLRGSTAADSSSVYIGTCTGARSRDLDLCRLLELPQSSQGTVNGSWITTGCVGGTGVVCGTGIGGVCGAGA